ETGHLTHARSERLPPHHLEGFAPMPFMPFNILGMWFRGLLAVAIIAGGIYLAKRWYDESHVVLPAGTSATAEGPLLDDQRVDVEAPAMPSARSVFRFEPGVNRETGYL